MTTYQIIFGIKTQANPSEIADLLELALINWNHKAADNYKMALVCRPSVNYIEEIKP